MTLTALIIFLVVGGVAGWLAGLIMKGSSFGLLWNIIIGIIGAVIGGAIFSLLGIHAGGIIGQIVVALIGAVILLYVIKLIKK